MRPGHRWEVNIKTSYRSRSIRVWTEFNQFWIESSGGFFENTVTSNEMP